MMSAARLLLCVLVAHSLAAKISLLPDPGFLSTTSFYLLHPHGDRSEYGPVGTNHSSAWKVAQWQIPTELAVKNLQWPLCSCDPRLRWASSTFNEYAAVCVCESADPSRIGSSFVLHQNGNDIACGKYTSTEEFDLFVSPRKSLLSRSLPIGNLSSLVFSFRISVRELRTHSVVCGPVCGGNNNVTYASVVASIVLRNELRSETLFVQIIILDTRSGVCRGILDPCVETQGPRWFFRTWPNYGVNFGVRGTFPGHRCLSKPGQSEEFQLNLLASLLSLREFPTGFDKDWEHWKVSSLYVGTLQQGKMESTIVVSDLDLQMVLEKFQEQ